MLWNTAVMGTVATATLRSARLVLNGLCAADALEMVNVLADARLYAFTGGEAPNLDQLEASYRAQVAGPTDSRERWHNWIVRLASPDVAIGFVQATVADGTADVAWLVGVPWQGQGYAREAAGAMCGWLRGNGIDHITAHIHPEHDASARVADALGLRPTEEVEDGERIWAS